MSDDLTAEELASLKLVVHPSSTDETGEQAYHANELRRVQRQLWVLRPRIIAQLQRLTSPRCEGCQHFHFDDMTKMGIHRGNYCEKLPSLRGNSLLTPTFSCAAFTPKPTQGGK